MFALALHASIYIPVDTTQVHLAQLGKASLGIVARWDGWDGKAQQKWLYFDGDGYVFFDLVVDGYFTQSDGKSKWFLNWKHPP